MNYLDEIRACIFESAMPKMLSNRTYKLMNPPEVFDSVWPTSYPGIFIGVHRGNPVLYHGDIPIYATYYIIDEMDTPLIAPEWAYFETPMQALFAADAYAVLRAGGKGLPDRHCWESIANFNSLYPLLPVVAKSLTGLSKVDRPTTSLATVWKLIVPMLDALKHCSSPVKEWKK